MQHQLRYSGTFVSREGIAWQCDILQQSETVFAHVGELRFEAEDPLVIEWHEADKEEPLQTSSATLKIESPGDRTYADLYTIEPGTVRLDILREGRLFWSGTLDPEFYEEPYERASHYPVTLTFSDFGILDRLKFEGAGVLSLSAIVGTALERACLRYDALDFSTLTSLCFPEEADAAPEEADRHRATLDRLAIVADNFFDEDGEPSTLREVVEGILQPLALRLVQREGQVWVYDLHALYHSTAAPAPIRWTADSQTLSVDKVANSVRINFSAYAQAGAITDQVAFGGKFTGFEHEDVYNGNNVNGIEGDYADGKFYVIYQHVGTKVNNPITRGPKDFTLYTTTRGSGVENLHHAARYGHVFPILGNADECDCIVWRAEATPATWSQLPEFTDHRCGLLNPATANFPPEATLFSTRKAYVPRIEGEKFGEGTLLENTFYPCNLGIKMELFADPRYNPFLEAGEENEKHTYDEIKSRTWLARVPVGVGIYDAEGRPLYHLQRVPNGGTDNPNYGWGTYQWVEGAPSYTDRVFLDYGSKTDPLEDCGIFGWKSNGLIGDPNRATQGFDTYPNGAHDFGLKVPYPPVGGWLRVDVYQGLYCFDHTEKGQEWMAGISGANPCTLWNKHGYFDRLRWLLYKMPEVTVYANTGAAVKADLDDIEYTGYINRAAKEELSLDTLCGTHTVPSPSARGVYLRSADSLQLHHLRRAGHTDHPERLLIGTLISQYSRRMTRLSGECAVTLGAHVFTEANQPGRRFLVKGEVLNAQTDTSEASFVEFRPDEWTAIEEVEPKG